MADLSPFGSGESAGDRDRGADRASNSDGDRAQLVLVTAMTIAVVLVALVLLVNAAIFTQNLATRDTDVGAGDALAFRATVADGVSGIVDRENRVEYGDRADLEANVTDGIEALDDALVGSKLDDGVSARINESTLVLIDGQLVRQTNSSRNFTDETGLLTDWDLVYDTNGTRRGDMRVARSALAPANETNASDAFHVKLVGNTTGTEWRMFVYENASTGDIAVAVQNDTASVNEICSVDAAEATIGLTNGTLAGESCPGLSWATGISDRYDVSYVNGDKVAGTYNITFRTEDGGTLNTLKFNSLSVGDSPYHVPAVYAVQVVVEYDAPELQYEETIRVAPGEPDD